ncbi:EAL domain-containing protein [Aestuariicella hydrocarbonica]|uniref:EAL domain-containing protein n=1 Tax=Pseudomaricurvus hydrocarbonicus TaxID=1470433 RepID=A0A9E5JTE3_9GAMM|nr:EAL domain-containing protein [Aestuariicella hydrocarbonica]NHO66209.1 EAL domain-containing protein [Aestuariicella hydrocarbonica]
MGLRGRLLITLLGLLLLSFTVLSASVYWFFEHKLRAEALSYQRNIASQLIIGARAEIDRASRALKKLSENALLVEALARRAASPLEFNRSAVQTSFDSFQAFSVGVEQVLLFDRQGEYLLHAPTADVVRGRQLDTLSLRQAADIIESGIARRFHADESGGRWLQSLAPVSIPADSTLDPRQGSQPVFVDAPRDALGYVVTFSRLDSFERMVNESDSSITRLFFSDNNGNFLVKSSAISVAGLPVDASREFGVSEGQQKFIEREIAGVRFQLNMQQVAPDLWLGSLIDQGAIQRNSLDLLKVLLPAAAIIFALIGLVFYSKVARLILRPIAVLIQTTRRISDGNYRPDIDVSSDDELGELAEAFRVMGRQLQDSNRQIAHLAYFDPLTQLPNCTTLKSTLTTMIESAKRTQGQLAVLFIDLDDFKKVNDRLGHAAGDELLVQVGHRLQRRLRSGDLLAESRNAHLLPQVISRRGGDEFNAVLNNIHDPREAALIAERLIVDINEPLQLDGGQVSVGASIGVAMFPSDGEDAETLLRHADMAMYEAKSLGKNKYYLFTEAMNAQVHQRLELEHSIAKGLQNREFEIHYQPKISLKTLEVSGFEALIRWHSPEKGVVSPAEFIPLAEESQLIHELGHWMMAEVLHQLNEWCDQLPAGVRIAMNISARQMAQENFAEHLISLAEQFNVPLSRLEIELTETSILTDEALVRQHLYALRTVGVKVCLDDFGTGYSSLTFLRSLPIDTVKIDRSFVMRLQEEGESRAIVLSVLELCEKLRLNTVAEGIENHQQFDTLLEHGCREGQGYLIARPLPAAKVLDYLRTVVKRA